MFRDPKNLWALSPSDEPTDGPPWWRFSLRTFLIAVLVIGALLGITARVTRHQFIESTPVNWRQMRLADVQKLSIQKRHVIAFCDPTPRSCGFGSYGGAYDNPKIRLKIYECRCETWYLNPATDADALTALTQRFGPSAAASDFILIDCGKVLPRRSKEQHYALAGELETFGK